MFWLSKPSSLYFDFFALLLARALVCVCVCTRIFFSLSPDVFVHSLGFGVFILVIIFFQFVHVGLWCISYTHIQNCALALSLSLCLTRCLVIPYRRSICGECFLVLCYVAYSMLWWWCFVFFTLSNLQMKYFGTFHIWYFWWMLDAGWGGCYAFHFIAEWNYIFLCHCMVSSGLSKR